MLEASDITVKFIFQGDSPVPIAVVVVVNEDNPLINPEQKDIVNAFAMMLRGLVSTLDGKPDHVFLDFMVGLLRRVGMDPMFGKN